MRAAADHDALHAQHGDITVRAPRAQRRRVTIGSPDARSAPAERLIAAEEAALSIAAVDQQRHEEHEEAVAQVAEQARREQAHIASLQLLPNHLAKKAIADEMDARRGTR